MIKAVTKTHAIYQYQKFIYPTTPTYKCRRCGCQQPKLTNGICNKCIDTAWDKLINDINPVYAINKLLWEA